jgi:hypothetical protein
MTNLGKLTVEQKEKRDLLTGQKELSPHSRELDSPPPQASGTLCTHLSRVAVSTGPELLKWPRLLGLVLEILQWEKLYPMPPTAPPLPGPFSL